MASESLPDPLAGKPVGLPKPQVDPTEGREALWSESPGNRYSVWGRMEWDINRTVGKWSIQDQNKVFCFLAHQHYYAQWAQHILKPKMCRGLKLSTKHNIDQDEDTDEPVVRYRCRQLFCPSCWHVTQTKLADLVAQLTFDWWYIRETIPVKLGEELDPKVIKRFKGTGQKYTTVGWMINPAADGGYQYIGIYGSDGPAPLKDKFASVGGRVLHKGKTIGAVLNHSFGDRDLAMEHWAKLATHPSAQYRDPDYRRWVEHAALQFAEQRRAYVAVDLL